jgi:uncharacterized protein (TIGR04442 family)
VIKDIRYHGKAKEDIDFFATVTGKVLTLKHFYEEREERGSKYDCFFMPGEEFRIGPFEVRYKGTGGWFSPYMFGEDLPLPDLLRKEVRNRLVIHGATVAQDTGKIEFTQESPGRKNFTDLFQEGHPVFNYFFFVHMVNQTTYVEKQEMILKKVGKYLKRIELHGARDDSELCLKILEELDPAESSVFLFKIVNLHHLEYYETFKRFYSGKDELTEEEDDILYEIAFDRRISTFQQERIRMDVIYSLPPNRRVIEEYRGLVADVVETGVFDKVKRARLLRLKTLGVRGKLPRAAFDVMDAIVLKRSVPEEDTEPAYVQEARSILEGLLLSDTVARGEITPEDVIKLLRAKKRAFRESEKSFEGMLLETGKNLDEKYKRTGTVKHDSVRRFHEIVALFDRFDAVSMEMNRIAYTEQGQVSPENLRAIVENRKAFEQIRSDFFEELFLKDSLSDKYLTAYGREKVKILTAGLKGIGEGSRSIPELSDEIKMIGEEERLYHLIRGHVRERLREQSRKINSRQDVEALAREIHKELKIKGESGKEISRDLLNRVILDIEKEMFYVEHLLPTIIDRKDVNLREDFFGNSGLDRFTIEELEREFFESGGLDLSVLHEIRREVP